MAHTIIRIEIYSVDFYHGIKLLQDPYQSIERINKRKRAKREIYHRRPPVLQLQMMWSLKRAAESKGSVS